MRRQKNLLQLEKKKKKNQEKTLEKIKETNNLPDKEFKTLLMRMLTELGERIDEYSQNFNKELGI